MPAAPVAQRRERSQSRQKVGRDRHGDDQRQGQGIASLRVIYFFGDRRKLFVSGVEPESERQPHSEYVE